MTAHRRGRTRPRWRKIADALLFVALAVGVALIIRSFGTAAVYTSIKVLDGDSLRDGAEEIRLHGIDAPEYRQTCTDAAGKSCPCGKRAARHLRKLIGNAPVSCQIIDADKYDRSVGVCSANGVDLNKAMVEAGWAIAYTRHSLSYVRTEETRNDRAVAFGRGHSNRQRIGGKLIAQDLHLVKYHPISARSLG